ncbi:hypothetical protein LCGC14_1123400 [marine sediment metagenome]|uniref:Carbamoyltransferase n=1 Tax=marine sediment metagenome TaxID=412755 RepID=A0A0F9Q960_9ZZZZ
MLKMSNRLILGIHIGHDSGAAIIKAGKILAAVNEERFIRVKHYSQVPLKSIEYCLKFADVSIRNIDAIAFSLHLSPKQYFPFLKLDKNFYKNLAKSEAQGFMKEIITNLMKILRKLGNLIFSKEFKETLKYKTTSPTYFKPFEISSNIPIYVINHHLAHAASAYYTSGFKSNGLIVTSDGIGSGGTSTAVWQAIDGEIMPLLKIGRNGSLGWFYGIITEGLGWWIGNGEGKTMGLAPYGDPEIVKKKLIPFLPIYKRGHLKREYNFSYPMTLSILDAIHWHFQESEYIKKLQQQFKREDIAAAAQNLLEKQIFELVSFWVKKLGSHYLCGAGGVFLNVKLNKYLSENLDLDEFHIFPNAGDGGLALGAALQADYEINKKSNYNAISDMYFGPEYSDDEIETILELRKIKYEKVNNLIDVCSKHLSKGKIIGWFQGRMEYGPRALGNRSILMDPRNINNKDIINKQVKFREPWRPFCPSILEDRASEYLMNSRRAPYMITSFDVFPKKIEEVPAVIHVDGTTRPQTVSNEVNLNYYNLIKNFDELTSVPMLLNTSFNVKGRPIVCNPINAIECFYNTGLDILAINKFIIEK